MAYSTSKKNIGKYILKLEKHISYTFWNQVVKLEICLITKRVDVEFCIFTEDQVFKVKQNTIKALSKLHFFTSKL